MRFHRACVAVLVKGDDNVWNAEGVAAAMEDEGGLPLELGARRAEQEKEASEVADLDGLLGPKGDVLDISDEDWHLGMDYYFLNAVRMTRLVTPIMQAQGRGSIVNISTFAAFEPDPDFPTSAVFRAGLADFAKLFSVKYAADGVRMNNVLPGFIDSLPEKQDRVDRIPAGRYGTVDEVSAMVSFLISDASSYVTGQNLRIDGGLTHSV